MAYSSGIEVLNQLLIAEALNYVSNEQIQKSRIKISEILAMLDALTKSLKL
jgi:four helix bundle protein